MRSRGQWILSAVAVPLVLAAGYGLGWRQHAPTVEPAADTPAKIAEYPSMTALRKAEKPGAYALDWGITNSQLIVVAPHGGGIELRTSELAGALAGQDHTWCTFKGLLGAGLNERLHVTSTNWDVEECLILIRQRQHALSIHGTSKKDGAVHIGGRDTETGAKLTAALRAQGFPVTQATGDLAGTSPDNFVNKDADAAGVQLELANDLRLELVPDRDGSLSPRGALFVQTVRSVYAALLPPA